MAIRQFIDKLLKCVPSEEKRRAERLSYLPIPRYQIAFIIAAKFQRSPVFDVEQNRLHEFENRTIIDIHRDALYDELSDYIFTEQYVADLCDESASPHDVLEKLTGTYGRCNKLT